METFKSLPEGTLAELIDNVLYMSPTPVTEHARVSRSIFHALCNHCLPYAEVLVAPFDVYLDETANAVEPDILVIMPDNAGRLVTNGHFHGAPDFIVEILSPSNRQHDLVRKKNLYERFGVREYWAVDPKTKLALGFAHRDGSYTLIAEQTGELTSELLGLTIPF